MGKQVQCCCSDSHPLHCVVVAKVLIFMGKLMAANDEHEVLVVRMGHTLVRQTACRRSAPPKRHCQQKTTILAHFSSATGCEHHLALAVGVTAKWQYAAL